MCATALHAEFEFLGVTPGDGLPKVREAYLQMKNLYAEDSLASYALLDPEARSLHLERIEQAYRRILEEQKDRPGTVVPLHPHMKEAKEMSQSADVVDPEQTPGLFLRRAREHAGMSLQDIARQTKVGTNNLACIEAERFGRLPAAVYLRGFLEQYARMVGLSDPRRIVDLYLQRFRRHHEQEG